MVRIGWVLELFLAVTLVQIVGRGEVVNPGGAWYSFGFPVEYGTADGLDGREKVALSARIFSSTRYGMDRLSVNRGIFVWENGDTFRFSHEISPYQFYLVQLSFYDREKEEYQPRFLETYFEQSRNQLPDIVIIDTIYVLSLLSGLAWLGFSQTFSRYPRRWKALFIGSHALLLLLIFSMVWDFGQWYQFSTYTNNWLRRFCEFLNYVALAVFLLSASEWGWIGYCRSLEKTKK
ncbi:MAG: hypothetical protein Q4C70_12195 [Planctomycetia bacterium]|nr:hypothetical protein [Planctomycetia bacterium]